LKELAAKRGFPVRKPLISGNQGSVNQDLGVTNTCTPDTNKKRTFVQLEDMRDEPLNKSDEEDDKRVMNHSTNPMRKMTKKLPRQCYIGTSNHGKDFMQGHKPCTSCTRPFATAVTS
jgi:hypothetical protein